MTTESVSAAKQAKLRLQLHSYPSVDAIPATEIDNVFLFLNHLVKLKPVFHPQRCRPFIKISTTGPIPRGKVFMPPIRIKRFACLCQDGHSAIVAIVGRNNQEFPINEIFLDTGHCLQDTIIVTDQPTFAPWLNKEKAAQLSPLKPGGYQVATIAQLQPQD